MSTSIYFLSETTDLARFNSQIAVLKNRGAVVEMKEKKGTRTLKQNNSIHLYCQMIADVFNELGWTFRFTGVKGINIEIEYTMILVKETIWRVIQMALFNKKSTKDLTRSEVTKVAEQIERSLALKGIDLPFPSIENKTGY